MYFKNVKLEREIKIDIARLIAVPLGGLLFMIVADWLFTFQNVSRSELFWFGFTVNAFVFMVSWLKFLSFAMLNEVLYLYVDAKRKEHEYSKAVWPTRQSKIVNLIIALIAIGVALIFYTYCYNNSLSGANHKVIFSTMFAQSHFPAHITVWELLWSLVRMLLLFTSLTFPHNITLSYTDKKSTSDNSYGTR